MKGYKYYMPFIYKIDNVPAYKAGEWPGIKSNKFRASKKIIRPEDNDIFFKIDESIIKPRNKTIVKPREKKIINIPNKRKINKWLEQSVNKSQKDIFPTIPVHDRNKSEKTYIFQKINKYHDKKKEEFEKYIHYKKIVNNINNNNSKHLMTKKNIQEFYDNISRNKILGISFDKDVYEKYRDKFAKMKRQSMKLKKVLDLKKYFEQRSTMKIKIKKEILARDIEYVNSIKL